MTLENAEVRESLDTTPHQGLSDSATPECRKHGQMLQIAAPAVMAGHDAAHGLSGFFCNEAQAGVAFEIALDGGRRIRFPQSYAGGLPKNVHYGSVVGNGHLADGGHRGRTAVMT